MTHKGRTVLKASSVRVITGNGGIGAADVECQVAADELPQTVEVVHVLSLRRGGHVLEAEVHSLDEAEAAVDDLHAGYAVAAVADGAAAGRRGALGRALHADAELCCVGRPQMHAVAVDAKMVVLGADAHERSQYVDSDDVLIVAATVAHGTFEICYAHARAHFAVCVVAEQTDVKNGRSVCCDMMLLFDELGKKCILATLDVNGKRVTRDMTVDILQLCKCVQVVLMDHAAKVRGVDLGNFERDPDKFWGEVVCTFVCDRMPGSGDSFARAIAALNGLLRSDVDARPVDCLVGVRVLQRTLPEAVCNERNEAIHAHTVEAGVDEKRHHEVFDRHVVVCKVDEVLEKGQAHDKEVGLAEYVHVADGAVCHDV